MAKRKRRRKRRKSANPKKRRIVRRKRRRASNPSRKRRHTRRRRRSNPARRHRVRRRRKHLVRAHLSNPRRRHGRRRSRRNPSSPMHALMLAGIAIAGFVAVQAGGYFTSKDGITNAQRNRTILAALAAAIGLFYVEKKKEGAGVALAIGSILGAIGGWITLKLFSALPAKGATSAVFQDNMQAVFQDNMQAVFQDNMQGYAQLGEYVTAQGIGDFSQIGDLQPAPPWQTGTPFDH